MNAFSGVNVTFYDVFHDVITTANTIPYTVKYELCLSVLEILKLNKIRR